ncbi:MAG: amidohydrolase [Gammaproteobacteria bacterium]|nr:amidohydrolase [Gammaproteobacteria bacterium]
MKFLKGFTLVSICLLSAFQSAIATPTSGADTIFFGGPIVTVNANNDEAQALAIQNGKIVAVGTKAAVIKDWKTSSTKVIDLKGQTLMPGFIEPHVHIILTSMMEGLWVNLSNFTLPYDTMDTISQKLKAQLKNVQAGGWLTGFGVDPSRTTPLMAEFTADILDKVSTDVPIFIINQSGHIGYVNHKALDLAGITDKTPNPPGGGIFVKDAKGKLTGKLVEPPSYLPFMAKIPAPTEAQLLGAVQKTMKGMAATGITTASDMSVGANLGVEKEVAIYKAVTANKAAPVRVRGYLFAESMPKGFKAIKPNEGDDRLRFIGVKFISDGSTQGLTAALNKPYAYPKGTTFRGNLNYKDEDIFKQAKIYFDQGWQISTHSNGDRAIDQTLNNYAKLLAGNPHPENRRLRIEHFTINNPEQVKKAVKLGVVPSFTIGHVDYWGEVFHDHIVGAERADRIDPAAAFKKEGSRFTLHSDSPVSPYGPLRYITEEVTRLWQAPPRKVLGPNERVTIDDAIRGVTINAAYQLMADDKLGSLEVGKQADLVILEKNPRKTAPEQIANIKVNETWIDGKPQAW